MPVFKRSITASRSTQNYQIRLRTFGATSKTVKSVFPNYFPQNECFLFPNRQTCNEFLLKNKLNFSFLWKITLHTFGRSSKSSQPNSIILSATWSCDAPLENRHNHITYLKLCFLVRPMRHHVSFFVVWTGQKRIHDQKTSKKTRLLDMYLSKLIWFENHY